MHDVRGGQEVNFLQFGHKEGLLKIQKRSFFITMVNMIAGVSYVAQDFKF